MMLKDTLVRLAAIGIGVFGFIMIAGTLIDLFDRTGQNSPASDLTLLILIGILPLLFGIWLFQRTQADASRRALAARERTILTLAGHHGGVLTIPEVAEESDMSLEQAKEILNRLNLKGYNEVAASDSGTILYKFPL